jgi:hypothetical protein
MNLFGRSLVAAVVAVGAAATIGSVPVEGQPARDQLRARVEAMLGTASIRTLIASRTAQVLTPPRHQANLRVRLA